MKSNRIINHDGIVLDGRVVDAQYEDRDGAMTFRAHLRGDVWLKAPLVEMGMAISVDGRAFIVRRILVDQDSTLIEAEYLR